MKRAIWMAAALGLGAAGLAGCGEAPDPAEAAPEGPEGISVSNARLMLPAVAGNPGAIYFDVVNTSSANRVIRAAVVADGGGTMMHTTVDGAMQEAAQIMVPAGDTVKLEPGGMHLMAMNLADTVTAGGTTEVTLTFVGGDKFSFPADVRAAGDER